MGTSFWLVIIAVALAAAAFAALLLSRIRVEIFASRVKDNDRITIDVRALFGLFRYHVHIPMVEFRNLTEGFLLKQNKDVSFLPGTEGPKEVHLSRERILAYYERAKLLLKNVFNLLEWMKETLSRLECIRFVWNTRVGIGNAPETAVTAGLVWGVKTSLLRFVFARICLKSTPNVQVSPQYNLHMFTTELTCKLQIRLGHVLLAGISLVPHIWKGKDSWKTWQHMISRPRLKNTS
jgi:hypothetical protein